MSTRSLPLAASFALIGGGALADVPTVTTDIPPVHSLVAQVMGDLGTPDLIIQRGATPHAYALRPSDARGIENAQAVFWIGASLTPWLSDTIETLAPDAESVPLMESDGTEVRQTRETPVFGGQGEHEDHGAHEHGDHDEHETHEEDAHGDHDHSGIDPHAWLDPENARTWLDTIANELARLDPDNAETYRANAADGQARINEVITEVEDTLSPMSDLRFVVFHDAYQYFETRFGLSPVGAIAVSDASAPSPARLSELRDAVEARNVECAFAEPQYNDGLVRTIFDGTDVATDVIDPVGTDIPTGPDFYPQLLLSLSETIAACR